ncbi:MAG: M48 family metallopeptidase [Caldilineaceae bacterium]|nr:M48 family metallopeptidase [Caldilineaceae bacterium]
MERKSLDGERRALNAGGFRHPMERLLLGICMVGSVVLFAALLLVAFNSQTVLSFFREESIAAYREESPEAADLSDEEVIALLPPETTELLARIESLNPVAILLGPLAVLLLTVWAMGREYGKLRANALRITARQFPQVYAMWASITRDLGMKKVPDLYTINGDGVLNAYAACVPGFRSFGALYSDILETCLRNEDWDSLKFILGHEAAHIRLGHVAWWYMLFKFVFTFPPFNYIIGLPLGRAQEYSCDKVGHAFAHDHDCKGLLMLTVGKHLYREIDFDAHMEETVERGGLWATLVNLSSGHPILAWRVNAIRKGHNGGLFLRRK